MRPALPFALGAALALTACGSDVASVRDALLDDDAARAASVVRAPACTDASCLDAIARKLGARHGFDSNDPDQASAAAVAVVLVRDRRGDLVPDADRWVAALTLAHGQGADALRLAVAHGMAEAAARVGRPVADEAQAAEVAHDLAAILPGACAAYALAGRPSVADVPAAETAEGSPCVQRDLERKDGPGAAYGRGAWRAAAGALALWKAEARALRAGLSSADPVVRPVLEAKLAVIDAASSRIELPRRTP